MSLIHDRLADFRLAMSRAVLHHLKSLLHWPRKAPEFCSGIADDVVVFVALVVVPSFHLTSIICVLSNRTLLRRKRRLVAQHTQQITLSFPRRWASLRGCLSASS